MSAQYGVNKGGYVSSIVGYLNHQSMYHPAGTGFATNDPRIQKLNETIQKYEISSLFAPHLHTLLNCEIVLLCDDSGSMNAPLHGSSQTRWDELKHVPIHKSSLSIFPRVHF